MSEPKSKAQLAAEEIANYFTPTPEPHIKHVAAIITKHLGDGEDKERMDWLLKPGSSIGVAEVATVKGSAVWWFCREGIDAERKKP